MKRKLNKTFHKTEMFKIGIFSNQIQLIINKLAIKTQA